MKPLSALIALGFTALVFTSAAPLAQADGHLAGEAHSANAIVERIRKVADVCVEGHACAEGATVVASAAAAGGGGAEGRYNSTCGTCHATGAAGAPKLGDKAAWEPRLAKGMDALYQSSIGGMPPAMPAKGLCMDCSDDELRSIVDYMVDFVR